MHQLGVTFLLLLEPKVGNPLARSVVAHDALDISGKPSVVVIDIQHQRNGRAAPPIQLAEDRLSFRALRGAAGAFFWIVRCPDCGT
jgi:hypothetical protein